MLRKVLLILLISNVAWADCLQSVTFYKEGEKVNCDSYGFTREAEAENRAKLDLGLKYQELNDLKDKKIDILNQRLDIYQKSYEEYKTQESTQTLKNIFYMVLGASIMYGALRLSSELNQR